MGDVLIIPDCDAESLQFNAQCQRHQVGRTAVLTFDNRCPPLRIVRENGVVFAIGAPLGDVGTLGDALLRGDLDAAKAAALLLDGHFAVFAISPDRIAAATDPAGSVPIYYREAAGRSVIGSRVNEVADITHSEPDVVSVYDFALHRGICHPYTWFQDVFIADPSCLIEVGDKLIQRHYWTPAEEPRARRRDVVHAFREQMTRAGIQAAEDKVGLLMSAGEDSRAVASFLPPEQIHGYIFLSKKNREWAFADLVAKVMGFPLAPLIRNDDDIAAKLDARQRLIGYGYDIMQGHIFPFVDQIGERRLLGGWTSDTLFKGYFLRPPRNGRFPKRRPRGYFEGPAADALRERYEARYAAIEHLVPNPAYEWMRIWPLSAHPHFPHYASARRFFDHRELYFYAKSYRLAPQLAPADKYSGDFFYEATNSQLGFASWIPTSRGTVPALNGQEAEFAKLMIDWHDKHVHPGVVQSPWGRAVQISASEQYSEISSQVERALTDFDGGRLVAWVAERAAAQDPGTADRQISQNRLIQIGWALHSQRDVRKGP